MANFIGCAKDPVKLGVERIDLLLDASSLSQLLCRYT